MLQSNQQVAHEVTETAEAIGAFDNSLKHEITNVQEYFKKLEIDGDDVDALHGKWDITLEATLVG